MSLIFRQRLAFAAFSIFEIMILSIYSVINLGLQLTPDFLPSAIDFSHLYKDPIEILRSLHNCFTERHFLISPLLWAFKIRKVDRFGDWNVSWRRAYGWDMRTNRNKNILKKSEDLRVEKWPQIPGFWRDSSLFYRYFSVLISWEIRRKDYEAWLLRVS